MSVDQAVTRDLIEVLTDGSEGFRKASEKLQDEQPDLAAQFMQFSNDRTVLAEELQEVAAAQGDSLDQRGTVTGAVHRGWMAMKDALSGKDPDGVLDAAVQGEDHAVSVFEKALAGELSPGLRAIVARQVDQVRSVRDEVATMILGEAA